MSTTRLTGLTNALAITVCLAPGMAWGGNSMMSNSRLSSGALSNLTLSTSFQPTTNYATQLSNTNIATQYSTNTAAQLSPTLNVRLPASNLTTGTLQTIGAAGNVAGSAANSAQGGTTKKSRGGATSTASGGTSITLGGALMPPDGTGSVTPGN
jgi:hypothetical protein